MSTIELKATGEIGAGKTTVLRYLKRRLAAMGIESVYAENGHALLITITESGMYSLREACIQ